MTKINDDLQNIYGFNKNEMRVWEAVSSAISIAEITKISKIPRMTVNDILIRFIKRKLVLKSKKFYSKNNQSSIVNNPNYKTYSGFNSIFQIWSEKFSHKRVRYLHYQPIVTLQKVFPKINTQELHKINKNIYENKHITDAYLEKGYFEAAKKFLSPEAFVAWMKNLKRMSVIYEVDKPVFYSPKDYFIFRDSLFIMDWAKEEAVEIKDGDVANSMKQLFDNLKSSSTRIDLNSVIRKYTENL